MPLDFGGNFLPADRVGQRLGKPKMPTKSTRPALQLLRTSQGRDVIMRKFQPRATHLVLIAIVALIAVGCNSSADITATPAVASGAASNEAALPVTLLNVSYDP